MNLLKTPKSVSIDITNRCNLRCSYCYHFESAGDVDQDLPAHEWLTFFEELNRCAVLNIDIAGGEPFLRKDIKEIIDGIVKNRMRFSILSNGALITDEMASYLISTKRCSTVQISIDGSGPETHDSCRGDGSFYKAMEGINRLKKHNVPLAVRVTIHKHNVRDLEEIARLLLEELGLKSFSTNSVSPFGLCSKNKDNILLSIRERELAMETLLRLNRKYNNRIRAMAGPLAEAITWKDMEQARQEKREAMPGRGYLRGCGGFHNKIGIRADGVMVPCTQIPHIELGRINRDVLKEVWLEHGELKRLRERGAIPLGEFEFCKGCEYIPYCTGNCPAGAYALTNKENNPDPGACLRAFLDNGGRLI